MGVYHLMGLGFSPGAVTGPLSYLGHRYKRWNPDDQVFFAGSGEVSHREQGRKVGDVQALVLFTTREVLLGKDEGTGKEMLAYPCIENTPGHITLGPELPRAPMKQILRRLLGRIWPDIAGGRAEGTVFWCEVDRKDIQSTYKRVARIVAALAGIGGQGKEIWMNLTGGSNVVNLALQLVSALSGDAARLYYVQADSQARDANLASAAIKCVRHTTGPEYWVELPAMPLAISRVGRATLDMLELQSRLSLKELYARLNTHPQYALLIQDLSVSVYRETYLTPMWKQRLIAGSDDGYSVGARWAAIRPYQEVLEEARLLAPTIEELARQESWLELEAVSFYR